jgi:hypothetical protein
MEDGLFLIEIGDGQMTGEFICGCVGFCRWGTARQGRRCANGEKCECDGDNGAQRRQARVVAPLAAACERRRMHTHSALELPARIGFILRS